MRVGAARYSKKIGRIQIQSSNLLSLFDSTSDSSIPQAVEAQEAFMNIARIGILAPRKWSSNFDSEDPRQSNEQIDKRSAYIMVHHITSFVEKGGKTKSRARLQQTWTGATEMSGCVVRPFRGKIGSRDHLKVLPYPVKTTGHGSREHMKALTYPCKTRKILHDPRRAGKLGDWHS